MWAAGLCTALVAALLIGACVVWMAERNADNLWAGAGLFSWDEAVMEVDGRNRLFDLMEGQRLTVLYQHIPSETPIELVREFLTAAYERGVTVWLLTGDPSWGLDPDGTRMVQAAQRVSDYNDGLAVEHRIAGILMDCEPYLTDEWDEEPDEVMEAWVSAMAIGRRAANERGLLFSACVPYYLDAGGYQAQLRELVRSGCDALAVMNYYKENEAAHIQTEVALARAEGRPVTVIYELQKPGAGHSLTDVNTYYHDGLDAVDDSWRVLIDAFGRDGLSIALHDYEALAEVTGIA